MASCLIKNTTKETENKMHFKSRKIHKHSLKDRRTSRAAEMNLNRRVESSPFISDTFPTNSASVFKSLLQLSLCPFHVIYTSCLNIKNVIITTFHKQFCHLTTGGDTSSYFEVELKERTNICGNVQFLFLPPAYDCKCLSFQNTNDVLVNVECTQ